MSLSRNWWQKLEQVMTVKPGESTENGTYIASEDIKLTGYTT